MPETHPPPFGFYGALRRCPACGNRLVTSVPLTKTYLRGPLEKMGVACWCVSCNTRYRAVSRIPFSWIGRLGPLGRALWWRSASLEATL